MKSLKMVLSMGLVCMLGGSILAVHNVDDLIYFAHAVKGKKIEIPASLSKEWHRLIAKGVDMHADHINEVAYQFQDPAREQYLKLARVAYKVADRLKTLPEMNHTMTFEHPEKMLWLKAKKAELLGKKLSLIGEQLNDPRISQHALEVSKWGKDLKEALKRSECAATDEVVEVQPAESLPEAVEEGGEDYPSRADALDESFDGEDEYKATEDNEGQDDYAACEDNEGQDDADESDSDEENEENEGDGF